MTFPSFKEYVAISEDLGQDIAALTMQKQQLILRKTQTDRTLDAQIAQIDKALLQKQKQQELETKKNGMQAQQGQQNQQEQQPMANRTTTPGSSSSQTPGSGAPQQNAM
jgi:hypothetical protein